DVPKWELFKVFYDGLDYHNQQFVMETSGGTFFSRPMEEEWGFFEKLSKGSKTQASVDPKNNHTSSASFVSNQHGTNSEISELSKKVDLLLRNLGKGALLLGDCNCHRPSNGSWDDCAIPDYNFRRMGHFVGGFHRLRLPLHSMVPPTLTMIDRMAQITTHRAHIM
nr:hypothetical protein [Tanacetum cinerariifolium]